MRYIDAIAIGAATVLSLAAGCASKPVADQQSLVRAEARIQDAEHAGAYEHAGEQLRAAREKLDQARLALENDEQEQARRLATQAELDAKLASAITSNQEMQTAVQELDRTIATLREESLRDGPQRTGQPGGQ